MNAIEKLQAERQRLVERLAEIDKILGQYEELERIAESYFATSATHTPSTDLASERVALAEPQRVEPTKPMMPMPNMRKAKTPMADFEQAVVEVLSEVEEPLDRSALYKALLDRDVVIGSADENADLNTLSARMSRMKKNVTNVRGYGYWLKDKPFIRGGYEPHGANDPEKLFDDGDDDVI